MFQRLELVFLGIELHWLSHFLFINPTTAVAADVIASENNSCLGGLEVASARKHRDRGGCIQTAVLAIVFHPCPLCFSMFFLQCFSYETLSSVALRLLGGSSVESLERFVNHLDVLVILKPPLRFFSM